MIPFPPLWRRVRICRIEAFVTVNSLWHLQPFFCFLHFWNGDREASWRSCEALICRSCCSVIETVHEYHLSFWCLECVSCAFFSIWPCLHSQVVLACLPSSLLEVDEHTPLCNRQCFASFSWIWVTTCRRRISPHHFSFSRFYDFVSDGHSIYVMPIRHPTYGVRQGVLL